MAGERAPDDRRRRILEATVGVIRERGFAGARVADIADAAGTSPGLVLYHFGSLAGALSEALTALEDAFYGEVEATLDSAADPLERLAAMVELGAGTQAGAGPGGAPGSPSADWRLWLELWVRALRDDVAKAARASLDRRWRAALLAIVEAGSATGAFRVADAWASTVRLASLMDGLAIQLALGDIDADGFRDLWLGAAALELGLDPAAVRRPRPAGVRPTAALRAPAPLP